MERMSDDNATVYVLDTEHDLQGYLIDPPLINKRVRHFSKMLTSGHP